MAVTFDFKEKENNKQILDKENLPSEARLYDDENERNLHINVIEMLSMRIGISQEEVKKSTR